MSAQPDPRSTRAAEYRKFYKTARWERLRRTQLGANPLCRYCYEREDIVEATVVDHIKKHDGDTTLFWDPCNLQSLCKPCHDGFKQRLDRGSKAVAYGGDGYPIDDASQ